MINQISDHPTQAATDAHASHRAPSAKLFLKYNDGLVLYPPCPVGLRRAIVTGTIRKPCAKAGCGQLTDDGARWCAKHAPVEGRRASRQMRRRRSGKPSLKWLHVAAWKGPNGRRAVQLMAEPLCAYCAREGRTRLASVADHVVPHREDWAAFWHGDLQSLCAPCHAGTKQREEQRGGGSISPAARPDTGGCMKNIRVGFLGGGSSQIAAHDTPKLAS